jgi:threonine/homoserine/homoserine lactone efflux protein
MIDALLFAFACALGFVAAIPIGPVQIETIKRAVAGHYRAAVAVICGSVAADLLYGCVALFGVAPALEVPWVLALFSTGGAVLLWVLAFHTWQKSKAPEDLHLDQPVLRQKRWGLLTGFLLGASNPPIILSWVMGVALAKRAGLGTPLTFGGKLSFLVGGASGLGGYLLLLGVGVRRVRHFFAPRALGRIYHWLAVTLLVLSGLFVYGAARFVAHGL